LLVSWNVPNGFHAHMAVVEREAAEALVREKGVDWARRYQELREAEWRERRHLVEFAAAVRRRWMENEKRCGTLEGYARLLELASKLGHNACEKDLAVCHRTEVSGPDGGPIRVELEAALKKVYGEVVEAVVVSSQCSVSGERNIESQAADSQGQLAEGAGR
jgi:hypothetical protein